MSGIRMSLSIGLLPSSPLVFSARLSTFPRKGASEANILSPGVCENAVTVCFYPSQSNWTQNSTESWTAQHFSTEFKAIVFWYLELFTQSLLAVSLSFISLQGLVFFQMLLEPFLFVVLKLNNNVLSVDLFLFIILCTWWAFLSENSHHQL